MEKQHQPYGYHICHKASGKMYIGVRTAKGCHPDEFWNPNYNGKRGYFTTSDIVMLLMI